MLELFLPTAVISLRTGYSVRQLRNDLLAGLAAALATLPLALALGMAAGIGPMADVYGAVLVGFLSSVFGAGRGLISRPTAAMATDRDFRSPSSCAMLRYPPNGD